MFFPALLLALPNLQTTWYVDGNATPPGLGTVAQPYARIDTAVAADTTVEGDRILVAPGDYWDEHIDFAGKEIVLESSGGPAVTTIHGLGVGAPQHALVSITQGEGPAAQLRGFTFRSAPGAQAGIAAAVMVSASSPRIENCDFIDNLGAGQGSGLYVSGGAPSIEGCTFEGNGGQGALYSHHSRLSIKDCTFGDSASPNWGGVVALGGELTIAASRFHPNPSGSGDPEASMHLHAAQSSVTLWDIQFDGGYSPQHFGRGVYLKECFTTMEGCSFQGFRTVNQAGAALLGFNGDLSVTQSTFADNEVSGGYGGAVALVGCRASFVNSILSQNQAEQLGGAIYKWGYENLFLVNSQFANNRAESGGAVYIAVGPGFVSGSYFTLNSASLTQGGLPNRGGAIAAFGDLTVAQTWFANNAAGSSSLGPATVAQGGALYAAHALTATNVLLEDNVALAQSTAQGGAIAGVGGGRMLRCIAKRNQAFANGAGGVGQGGAVFGNLVVEHGSIASNAATTSGGGVHGGLLDHSILYNNQPAAIGGNGTALYSLVPAGSVGTNNLTGDPSFWGSNDLHLKPGSICIDAGDPNRPTDPNGTPLDLGAILFDYAHCGPGCTGFLQTNPCQSHPNSRGLVGTLRVLGNPAVSSNLIVLLCDRLPQGLPGYYLMATQAGFAPFFGGSQGNLCLGGSLYRLNESVQIVNTAGQVSRSLDLTQLPPGANVLPGSTWHFQFWHRDFIGVTSTSNTTESASVTFQ